MEDKNDVVDDDSIAEEDSIFDQPEGTDWFLAWLISYADNYDIEMGVSLYVGGSIVSGKVISGRVYFQKMKEEMLKSANVNASEEVRGTLLEVIAEGYGAWSQVYPKPDEYVSSKPMYIHLSGAHIISSAGEMPSGKGVLWRGKLSAVDGVSVGELRMTQS